MIFVYVTIVLALLYYFLTRNNNYWESRGVPFDKPFFIFGSFYDVVRGKQHFSQKIRELYSKYSDSPYVGVHVFTSPALMVRSPEMLKKVLVKDFDKFINRPIASNEEIDPIAFHTLFSAKDTTWRNVRAKISPVFTSGKMKLMLPLIKECTNELVGHLKEHSGSEVEIKSVFKRYTVDVIASCAFGINANCLKNPNSEILQMATRLLDLKSIVRNISVFSFFFVPALVKLFRLTFADRVATNYFINIFDATMKERQKLKVERHDLIDLLYSLKANETFADKYKFDTIKMAAQSVSFFSAGNDTTSSILTFAAYELALNPDVQNRLREELKGSCDAGGDFSYETVQSLKYLDMVVKETHRKYPLTTFLNREVATDYTFEETGLRLKKDDQVLIPLSGLHYDPEFYPEPEKFNPERFSDENKGNITSYTYMPFGDGPRVCIGERFAHLVTKLALCYVVRDFRIELAKSTSVPLKLHTASLFMQPESGFCVKLVEIKA